MGETIVFLFLAAIILWSVRTTMRAMRREREQKEFDVRWSNQERLYRR